jgi:hypothetical protein
MAASPPIDGASITTSPARFDARTARLRVVTKRLPANSDYT